MTNLGFLVDPNDNQIEQLIDMYRAEGWWTIEADDFAVIRKIVSGSHCFAVAVSEEGRVIGMGRAISDRASDAYIQDVAVDGLHRNLGIGTKIVKYLVARLRRDGIGWIGLVAERGSYGFYERMGFAKMRDSTPMLKVLT